VSAKLTPRQAQGHARLVDILYTARAVKGDAFGAVVFSAVQARCLMAAFDFEHRNATMLQRTAVAARLMDCVRQLATALALPPGQLAEALRHARVAHREAFER
jgi:hypothetical protein